MVSSVVWLYKSQCTPTLTFSFWFWWPGPRTGGNTLNFFKGAHMEAIFFSFKEGKKLKLLGREDYLDTWWYFRGTWFVLWAPRSPPAALRGPFGPLEAFLDSWGPSKILRALGALVRFFGASRSSAVALKGPSWPLRAGGGAHTFIFFSAALP